MRAEKPPNIDHFGIGPFRCNEGRASVSEDHKPMLKVVSGNPTPEELAAIIAVVSRRRVAEDAGVKPWSAWSKRSRLIRPPMRPGPGAWRGSAMPR